MLDLLQSAKDSVGIAAPPDINLGPPSPFHEAVEVAAALYRAEEHAAVGHLDHRELVKMIHADALIKTSIETNVDRNANQRTHGSTNPRRMQRRMLLQTNLGSDTGWTLYSDHRTIASMRSHYMKHISREGNKDFEIVFEVLRLCRMC